MGKLDVSIRKDSSFLQVDAWKDFSFLVRQVIFH